MNTKLINFRTPQDLQETFDMVCHYKSQTRTQVLINLMREYVLNQHQPIVDQIHSLQDLNKNLSEIIKKDTTPITLKKPKQLNSDRDLWVRDEDDYQYPFFRGQF
jgi:hypothetical protein